LMIGNSEFVFTLLNTSGYVAPCCVTLYVTRFYVH
jgi:hypothetical protein